MRAVLLSDFAARSGVFRPRTSACRTLPAACYCKVFSSYVGAFGAIAEVLSRDSTDAIETATMTHGGTTLFSAPMLHIEDVHTFHSVLAQFIEHWLTPKYISKISKNLIENMLIHETAWQVEQFDGVAQMKDVFRLQFAEFANNALQKMIVLANMEPPSTYGGTVDDILRAMSETIDNDLLEENGIPLSNDKKWALFNDRCACLGYPVGRNPLTDAAKKIYDSASAVRQHFHTKLLVMRVLSHLLLCTDVQLPHCFIYFTRNREKNQPRIERR